VCSSDLLLSEGFWSEPGRLIKREYTKLIQNSKIKVQNDSSKLKIISKFYIVIFHFEIYIFNFYYA
jgi:hypothetical protein